MTKRPRELRRTAWGIAAPEGADVLSRLASRRVGHGVPWRVVEGSELVALLVGEGEPDEAIAREAAAAIGRAYLLDFHDEAASTEQLGKNGRSKRLADHPAGFLRDHAIVAPGYELRVSPVRSAVIVDGFKPERVRKVFAREGMGFVPHSRGTLVTGGRGTEALRYATQLDTTVYTVLHNLESGFFACSIDQPGQPEQIFYLGELANLDKYKILDAVLGASTPTGICRALEIDPTLLGLNDQ
jgi:hypothetical protein